MDFDVYFQVGGKLCGPFTSSAETRAEMITQAASLGHEWHLPRDAVVVVYPKENNSADSVFMKLSGFLFGSVAAVASMVMVVSIESDTVFDGACFLCSILSSY